MHIKSFAKINLTLDVGDVMPNGMHPVDMIMQQVSLHDDVLVSVRQDADVSTEIDHGFSIIIKTNKREVPTDSSNLAFRAAELMAEKYVELFNERAEEDQKKTICIFIDKRIPLAAGLAGGSGNAAAVIHALNAIWELNLTLEELCEIGKKLGSDVPFCIIGQVKSNFLLPKEIKIDRLAATCARAKGTGTELKPIFPPLRAHIIIAKPRINVSTAEVYRGIDECKITERPENEEVEKALVQQSLSNAVSGMVNVLENYTLKAYPEVKELKAFMENKMSGAVKVLMSGSGPSVFAVFDDELAAIGAFRHFKDTDYEAFLCKTI